MFCLRQAETAQYRYRTVFNQENEQIVLTNETSLLASSMNGNTTDERIPSYAEKVLRVIVPSISALLVVVGYISELAHDQLLGLDLGIRGLNVYVVSAGSFLRETAYLFADASLLLDWSTGGVLVGAVFLGLGAWRGWLLAVNKGWNLHAARIVCFVSIVILFGGKWVLLDHPLLQLSNVLDTGPGGLAKVSDPYVLNLAEHLICSKAGVPKNVNCGTTPSATRHRKDVRQIYYTNVIVTFGLSIVCILMVMRASSLPIAIFAVFPLIYLFTMVPVAYGKLLRSTSYAWGTLEFKSKFTSPELMGPKISLPINAQRNIRLCEQDESSRFMEAPSTLSHDTREETGMPKSTQFPAFILGRDDKLLQLLIKQDRCENGQLVAEWRFWEASVLDLLVVREIEQRDVLEWVFRKKDAPPKSLPPASNE